MCAVANVSRSLSCAGPKTHMRRAASCCAGPKKPVACPAGSCARQVIYRASHEQRSSFRRKMRKLRVLQDRGSAKRGAIRPIHPLSHKETVPFRERSLHFFPQPAARQAAVYFFFSSFFGSSAGAGATYPSGCSSWTIADFCIGMRQFLLLPNSTMTVSFVMSMTTP